MSVALHPGQEKLDHIRSRALDRMDDLAPLIVARFDGVERTAPDMVAAAEYETCGDTVRLVDIIAARVDWLPIVCRELMRK